MALGLAHYTNEDTLLHAGVSYAGSSHLAVNAGVTWRFGSDERQRESGQSVLPDRNLLPERYMDGPITSMYIMQEEMEQVLNENEAMKEKMEAQDQRIEELEKLVRQLVANQ